MNGLGFPFGLKYKHFRLWFGSYGRWSHPSERLFFFFGKPQPPNPRHTTVFFSSTSQQQHAHTRSYIILFLYTYISLSTPTSKTCGIGVTWLFHSVAERHQVFSLFLLVCFGCLLHVGATQQSSTQKRFCCWLLDAVACNELTVCHERIYMLHCWKKCCIRIYLLYEIYLLSSTTAVASRIGLVAQTHHHHVG